MSNHEEDQHEQDPKDKRKESASDDEEWEDENPEAEEEGIFIEDGMNVEFDEHGNIVGVTEHDESTNTDADLQSELIKAPKLPHISSIFTDHTAEIVSLAINPVNSLEFMSGGMDDQLVIWNHTTASKAQSFKFSETVAFVEYGFDGKMAAAATLDDKIRVFEKGDVNWSQKFEMQCTSEEISVS